MTEVEGPNLPLLERLAAITGGRSFVATDADALEEVFQTISALEKPVQESDPHPLRRALRLLGGPGTSTALD